MSLAIANRRGIALAVWLFTNFCGVCQVGAAQIEIQVVMEPGVSITAPQEWAKLLGNLGLGRVQLRSARSGDRPEVTLGAGDRIKVVAILNRRSELVLPKRRFKSHDLAALRKYFQDLPIDLAEGDEERGRFDLNEKQFRTIYADLSKLIDFSTIDMSRAKLLSRAAKKFATPLEFDPVAKAMLSSAPLAVELRGKAAGTGLALVLRQEGIALKPEKPRGEPLRLRVIRYDRAVETWPVGWKSEAVSRQLAPKMFETLNIEIDGYSLTQALDALKPRLGIEVVMDEWLLKRKEIEPDKVQVKLKRGKTYLKKAVDRILSQARLSGEMRVDELGQPFYWVTQFGKDSLRAK